MRWEGVPEEEVERDSNRKQDGCSVSRNHCFLGGGFVCYFPCHHDDFHFIYQRLSYVFFQFLCS